DLEVASMPVTRFLVRRPTNAGGIAIALQDDDPQSVVIRFLDADGGDIDEASQRKVERLFAREDFRRVLPGEVGDIGFPPRALEQYAVELEECIDVDAIRASKSKAVIDYAFGATSFVMPNVLSKLGTEVLGVNPYVSTTGLIAYDRDEHAGSVAALVRASGSTIGAVLAPGGERLTLIDDSGHVLSDTETLLSLLVLHRDHLEGKAVALPVST
ncbi:hypothetical protein B7486_71875, partial [cyanobacterium TDX16]